MARMSISRGEPRAHDGDDLTGLPVASTHVLGYISLHAPHHPLANKNGTAARHRVVLWDGMGLGWGDPETTMTPCAFCGWHLPWKVDDEHPMPAQSVVNVDHINSAPGDDRLENLRPLCYWCNSNREFCEARFDYQTAARMFCKVAPWDRPNLRRLASVIIDGGATVDPESYNMNEGVQAPATVETMGRIADTVLGFVARCTEMQGHGPSTGAIHQYLGAVGFSDNYLNSAVLKNLRESGKITVRKRGRETEHHIPAAPFVVSPPSAAPVVANGFPQQPPTLAQWSQRPAEGSFPQPIARPQQPQPVSWAPPSEPNPTT